MWIPCSKLDSVQSEFTLKYDARDQLLGSKSKTMKWLLLPIFQRIAIDLWKFIWKKKSRKSEEQHTWLEVNHILHSFISWRRCGQLSYCHELYHYTPGFCAGLHEESSGNLNKKLLASDLLCPIVILWHCQTVEWEVVHKAERWSRLIISDQCGQNPHYGNLLCLI